MPNWSTQFNTCFPSFGMFGMFNPVAYDMLNLNPFSQARLNFNSFYWQNQGFNAVYNNLFTMNYPGAMSLYPTGGAGFGDLTNPLFAAWQVQTGQGNNSWFNGGVTNPWATPWGSMWQYNGTKPDSSTSNLTTEEKAINRKVNTLRNLLSQFKDLKDFEGEYVFDSATRGAIADGLKDLTKQKTVQEKLDFLKDIYDNIDKTDLKAGLALIELKDENNKSVSRGNIRSQLTSAGYETSRYKELDKDSNITKDIDASVQELHEHIARIKPDNVEGNANIDDDDLESWLRATNNVHILDVISSWNTQYATKSADEKNIIKYLNKYYGKLRKAADKETMIESAYMPIVGSMRKHATEVANTKTSGSKYALDKDTRDIIINLANKLEIKDNKLPSDLANTFEELYVVLRLAETAIARDRVLSHYSFLEDEALDDSLFMNEAIADLKQEGLSTIAAKYSDKVNASGSADGSGATGSGAGAGTGAGTVQDSDKEDLEFSDKTPEQTAYDAGKLSYTLIHGCQTKEDTQVIENYLKELKKDTILSFMDGFWDANGGVRRHEGMMEIFDDDNTGNNISWASKKNIVKCILEKANSLGFNEDNDPDYKEIKHIYKMFADKDGLRSTKENFKSSWDPSIPNFWKRSWKWMSSFIAENSFNERLDDCIDSLYHKMKAKINPAPQPAASEESPAVQQEPEELEEELELIEV